MEAHLQGWLSKQGTGALGKGFKRRYFRQKGTLLYYYKQEKDENELGFVNVAEAISCDIVDEAKHHFQIKTPKRIWQLISENENDFKYWVDGLKNVIERLNSDENSLPRQSVRLETMENRIRDVEAKESLLRNALEIAAKQLGKNVDELIAEAEGKKEDDNNDDDNSDNNNNNEEQEQPKEEQVEDNESSNNDDNNDNNDNSQEKPESNEDSKESEDDDDKPKRFKATVLYDYAAQQDYEMTIHVDEIITVLSKHGNGWWLGATSDGKQGYFPGSYVQQIED